MKLRCRTSLAESARPAWLLGDLCRIIRVQCSMGRKLNLDAKAIKKDLKWAELGFQYHKTDFRFTASYKNGQWSDGELISEETIAIHEGAPALHYAQQCFEGLKAQTAEDGRILGAATLSLDIRN